MNIKDIKNVKFYSVISKREISNERLKVDVSLKSPDGRFVFYTYGSEEPRMGWVFGNFIVAKIENHFPVLMGENSGLRSWGLIKPAVWSKNSRYLIVDIYPASNKVAVTYRSGKLILDFKLKRYTVIMIAGGFFYNNLIIKRTGKIILSEKIGETGEPDRFSHIDNSETHVEKLKWVPLEKFSQAVSLYEKGYFGNVLGYVNDKINIRFKKGFTPWPYKDAGIK